MSHPVSRLVRQVLLGVDTASAFLLCGTFGLYFGTEPDLWHAVLYILIAGIASYLPDLDLIPFTLWNRRGRWDNHWEILHHPLLVIPIGGVGAYWLAAWANDPNPVFVGALVAVCITAHFAHDSVAPYGLHWFSPINWRSHLVLHPLSQIGFVDSKVFEAHERQMKALMEGKDFLGRLEVFLEPVTWRQVLYWLCGAGVLLYWALPSIVSDMATIRF